jgi:pimeloyl-ACP methyl ester carboxylesterase
VSEQFTEVRGIRIAYETFGDRSAQPLLLIFGMNGQMIWWNDDFCRQLVDLGFFVIRFDNRDSGRSQDVGGSPRVWRSVLRLTSPRYTVADLSDDAVGVLDAVGVQSAHVVGLSMGAMIAQTVAIRYRRRVRSMTSIMGTTGRLTVGTPTKLSVLPAVFGRFPTERNATIERTMVMLRALAGTKVPFDEDGMRDLVSRSADRGINPAGSRRQLAAVLTQPDRTRALHKIDIPTLVVHGTADPLIGISGGRATAETIPGARLLAIDGMGHDLPRYTWDEIIAGIAATADLGEQQRNRASS